MPIKDKIQYEDEGGCGGEPRWKENWNVVKKKRHYITYRRLAENESFLCWGESDYSTSARGTMIRGSERYDGVSVGGADGYVR